MHNFFALKQITPLKIPKFQNVAIIITVILAAKYIDIVS